jgi:hypothetical protein
MSQESGQPRQTSQGSRIGWYLGGCFVLMLVLAAVIVLLGFVAVPVRIYPSPPVNTLGPTVTGTPATPVVYQP